MAHNSLPSIQRQQPTNSDHRQFLWDVEQYMNNMFTDTRQRFQEFCDNKGYTEKTSHALFILIEDRYFMLQQKPHYIIKNFSDDTEELVYPVCLCIFNSSKSLKSHWANT